MMEPGAVLNPEATLLLREAAEWRLLGLLFEYPSAKWRAGLESLLPSLPEPELRSMAEAALAQSSEGVHIALFGPAGSVPVREVTYRGGVQFGYLMAELSAYYEAFGYEPGVEEAADHLSVQLGFAAFLKLKHALAVIEGDAERTAVAADAMRDFLRDHIAVQAEPVLHRLREFAPEFLVDAARRVLQHAGPPPHSGYPLGEDLSNDAASDEITCGPDASGEDLIRLQP